MGKIMTGKISFKSVLRNALLAALVLAAAVNAAAGGQGSSASPAAAGRKKFSILNTAYAQAIPPPDIDINNNQWANIFKRELPDIDIEWIIIPPDQLQQRQSILVGSGDVPDVIPMSMAQMIQWSDMGVIQHIDSLHDRMYPNIRNFLSDDDLKPTKYNGHTYGIMIPANRLQNPTIMVIRTDWLEKVRLPMPKTIDELYNVLRAFTFDDPDGNGQNDTYGLTGCVQNGVGFGYMWQIFSAFGVQNGVHFTRVGNQIVPDFIRPEMRSCIEFLARLYREGILDKDCLVMNGNQVEDKGVRGIVGLFGIYANGIAARAYPNMLAANPNAKVEIFVPPAAPDGNIMFPIGRNGGGMRGVSARCAHPDAVLTFFNWMIEQDTSTLPFYTLNADKVYNGTVGVHTVPLGNKFILEMAQAMMSQQGVYDLWRYGYRTHMGTMQVVPDEIQFEISTERVAQGMIHPIFLEAQQQASRYGKTNAAAITGPVYSEYITDINTFWEETLASIISGARPITALDEFTRFFYANGGQKIIDEVTALNR